MIDALNIAMDCMILTETCAILDKNVLNLKGYRIVYNEGTYNQNDKVVLYDKEMYQTKYEIHKNIDSMKVIESQTCCIQMYVAVYRFLESDTQDFMNNLQTFSTRIDKNIYDFSVFTEDINIDLLKNKALSNEYLNMFGELGYVSTVNNPTQIQGSSK